MLSGGRTVETPALCLRVATRRLELHDTADTHGLIEPHKLDDCDVFAKLDGQLPGKAPFYGHRCN